MNLIEPGNLGFPWSRVTAASEKADSPTSVSEDSARARGASTSKEARIFSVGARVLYAGQSLLSKLNLDFRARTQEEPAVQEGYSPEAASVTTEQPHSIHDLGKYLAARIPSWVVEDASAHHRKIEIHRCTDIEAVKSLQERGFTSVAMVSIPEISGSPAGGHLLLSAHSPKTGEIRYALTQVMGDDMNLHNQLQLRLSGVDPAQVLVFDHHPDYGLFLENALKKVGTMPSRVIIGYRGVLKAELTRRALYARKLTALKTRFGDNVYSGIIARLKQVAHDTTSPEEKNSAEKVVSAMESRKEYESLLSFSREDVFRKGRNAAKMAEFERFLRDLSITNPRLESISELFDKESLKIQDGSPGKTYAGETVADLLLPSQVFTVIKENGEKEKILNLRFLYGDMSGKVAEKAISFGAREIVHIGNSGVLSQDTKIGELYFPSQIIDRQGRTANPGIKNSLGEFAASEPAEEREDQDLKVHFSTLHTKVSSPLLETRALVESMKSRGIETVDVEAAEIAKAVWEANSTGQDVKLSTVLLVSDIPGKGSEKTIEYMKENEWNEAEYRRSFPYVIDKLLEYWKIKDVEVSGARRFRPKEGLAMDAPVPATPRIGIREVLKDMKRILSQKYVITGKEDIPERELACRIAERILEKKNLNDSDHSLWKSNIATYLFNGASPRTLEEIWKDPSLDSDGILSRLERPRWKGKLERDLKSPFTDREVFDHIESLNSELSEKVKFILSHSRGFPTRMYIIGSFAKGRLGANSDLDVLVETNDPELRAGIGDDYARLLKDGKEDRVSIVPIPYQNRFLSAFNARIMGKKVEITDPSAIPGDENFLLSRYGEILKKRDYQLAEVGALWTSGFKIPEQREVTSPLLENLLERYVEKQHKSFETKEKGPPCRSHMREILGTLAGAMLLCPVLGAALGKTISLLLPVEGSEYPTIPKP